ncbi:hypothetical protein LINPERPRIM_LOCUS36128 [Linum perenne]
MIRNMSKFPRVRNLELVALDVAQEDIEGICCLEELEELKLHHLRNIERIVKAAKPSQSLEQQQQQQQEKKDEPQLSISLEQLWDVDIRNCKKLSDEDLSVLRAMGIKCIQWPHESFTHDQIDFGSLECRVM